MNVTWSEEAIRGLGVKTGVETAGAIFGLSRTQSYEAVKAGRFPVPVVPVGDHRLVVPVAPILRLLGMGSDAPGQAAPAAIDPEQLADLVADRVADRVVRRLAAAMAGTDRADPLPDPAVVSPARLQSVAGAGGADAAA